jgi:hypothetical protein
MNAFLHLLKAAEGRKEGNLLLKSINHTWMSRWKMLLSGYDPAKTRLAR